MLKAKDGAIFVGGVTEAHHRLHSAYHQAENPATEQWEMPMRADFRSRDDAINWIEMHAGRRGFTTYFLVI